MKKDINFKFVQSKNNFHFGIYSFNSAGFKFNDPKLLQHFNHLTT